MIECYATASVWDALAQWIHGCLRHRLPAVLAEMLLWSVLWLPVLPVIIVLGRRLGAWWMGRAGPNPE